MPKHPWHGIQASVMVENTALDEYGAKTDGNFASVWIPSIVGKVRSSSTWTLLNAITCW